MISMDRIKKFYAKNKLYILYLFIILVAFGLFFIVKNIYPIGNKTFVRHDLDMQYRQMYYEIGNRIHSGKQITYSFNNGIGIPLYKNIFNYMLNPTLLLYLIIPNDLIAIEIIIIINVILIGLSMIYYLKHKFKSDDLILLIPALCFSLCGWVNAYFINIMWISALWLLPLITYGIEKLINTKKYKLYLFSLSLAIIFNFYMGYMLCVFSAIYFVIYNLYKIKNGSLKFKINELSRNFLNFSITSILSVLLSSVILLPILSTSSSLSGKLTIDIGANPYNYTIIQFLAANFAYSKYTFLSGGKLISCAPNIYTGLISIFCLIPFILNKNIKINTKIAYLTLLVIFILIMKIFLLDLIINLLHVPAGFPYRYSFMYSFALSIILAYQLINIDRDNKMSYIISYILLIIIEIIIYIFNLSVDVEALINITPDKLIYNVIILTCLLLTLLFANKKYLKYILIVLVSIELGSNLIIANRIVDANNIHNNTNVMEQHTNETFYRQEIYNSYPTISLVDNFYSISSFNSMNSSDLYDFFGNVGIEVDYSAHIRYLTGNKIVDTLMSIKYKYNMNKKIENEYYLSLLYGVDKRLDYKTSSSLNRFETTNEIVNNMTNISDIYHESKYKNKAIIYSDDKYVIYDYEYKDNSYVQVDLGNVLFCIVGDTLYSIYEFEIEYDISNYNNIYIRFPNILNLEDNHLIIAYFKNSFNEDYISSYQLDMKKYYEFYNYLNRYPAKIDYFNEYLIEASINLDKDISMMSSIPYDQGWHVYIDDKEVDTYAQYNSFLGFDISKGEHKIKLRYKTPYLIEGLVISLTTFLLIIVYEIIIFLYKKRKTTSK